MKLVTPTGIEPMSPPWKGDVLTAWPRGQKISDENLRLVSYPRLERGTTWLKVKCSTTWANSPNSYRLTRLLLYITLLFLSCQHFFYFFLFFFKKCFYNSIFEYFITSFSRIFSSLSEHVNIRICLFSSSERYSKISVILSLS